MARLFEEVFTDASSGDIDLLVSSEFAGEESVRLRCHSLILTQHPYFYKMLSAATPLREGLTREVVIAEPRDEFVELIRFIYTHQVDIGRVNVAGLLMLADKYCIDEVVDLCLKYIKDNFDADIFFTFYNFTTLNSAYQEKLREQLMAALSQRRNLCSITEDARWRELPIELVEVILSQDDLPIASEAEVLMLIAQWLGGDRGQGRRKQDVARLLRAFRKCENVWVRVSDIGALMGALGVDLFSSKEPRTGSAMWDPSFVIHRHEAAGPVPLGSAANADQPRLECDHGEVCHQLGPKDFLQQEPGWMYPGVHRCHVSVSCSSWSHRERRLLRTGPTQAAALQKRAFECSTGPASKPAGHERSPSPPPAFQLRMPPLEALDAFDIGQEQRQGDVVLGGGVMRSLSHSQDKIDHELVDHQIICGVSSGYQRHGMRFSQREKNAIYLVEDLNGKQSLHIGGTTFTVAFDLELIIGEASKCGIRRCRFALLRGSHTLLEEWFDVSAKVPLNFYISSSYFDKNSSYTVSLRWLRPVENPVRHYYLRQ
mmetsp:Transcript_38141/g.119002  ORF Transcript_38141/g.119002 Transcript_38141/m.119002 type:complete len:542 (-) Transcript_38141:87-1712(-)